MWLHLNMMDSVSKSIAVKFAGVLGSKQMMLHHVDAIPGFKTSKPTDSIERMVNWLLNFSTILSLANEHRHPFNLRFAYCS